MKSHLYHISQPLIASHLIFHEMWFLPCFIGIYHLLEGIILWKILRKICEFLFKILFIKCSKHLKTKKKTKKSPNQLVSSDVAIFLRRLKSRPMWLLQYLRTFDQVSLGKQGLWMPWKMRAMLLPVIRWSLEYVLMKPRMSWRKEASCAGWIFRNEKLVD